MNVSANKFSLLRQNGKTTRYVAVAFGILAITLLSLSVLSFLGAKNVQENYNSLVSEALVKLDIINTLNHNEDATYNAALAHLSSNDPLLKHAYEQQIALNIQKSDSSILLLSGLLQENENAALLEQFIQERNRFNQQLNTLLTYSRQGRDQKAHLFNNEIMTPAFQAHQKFLSGLSDNVRETMRRNGNETIGAISHAVNVYGMALLLALGATLVAATLVQRVFRRLKRDNELLSLEIQERQLLEDALSESQRQYKMLFDNNPIPMWLFDQHTYNFLEINEAALKEYGFTREEFLSSTILDIRPKKDIPHLLLKLTQADKWATASGNWQHMRKDGSVFPVETRSHAMPVHGEIHPRLVTAVNIEDRLRAIDMLERSEKQLREVSSSIPGAVFQMQQTNATSYAFTFISDGIEALSGLTPEDILANPQTLFKTIHRHDLVKLGQALEVSYQSLTPLLIEYRQWQPLENKWRWIRGHGLPTLRENKTIIWNGTLIDITHQKEAQDKLANSEANLRALLDSSPQAIYLLDKDLNVVLYNAVAAQEVRQHLLKKLEVGESILNFISSELKDEIIQNHEKAMQGDTILYESGRGDYWHEIAFRPVLSSSKDVLAVSLSILDISEQKQVLETIKRNESQLARAQQLAQLGNWEYDIKRDIMSWPDDAYKIFGVSKETFRPTFHNFMLLIHPADREQVQAEFNKAIAEKSLIQVEHRIVMPNKSERVLFEIGEVYCDDEGNAVKISGSVQDITARKQAEKDVREAKNLLQSTLENIPEIIFSADSNFELTYISPQCYELTGYYEEELLQDTDLWWGMMFEEDRSLLLEQILPTLYAGQRQQCELRITRRDGEVKWLMFRLSPLRNEDGLVIRIDGSASDMTQYKEAETKRKELTDELLKQNQNLQQFAYIVSHNLRAPIANILGLTSIYNKQAPDDLINHTVIDNLYKSANLLDATIRDLNDILTVRSELTKVREEIHFQDMYEDILSSIEDHVTGADFEIDFNFNEAPTVTTVRSYIHSIMQNLITNAFKYRCPTRKLQLKLKTFLLPNYICLSVSDNGLGIDLEKEKEKVFGLYKRFHPKTEGKGIGLHLVKTQAELLGGKVEVESQPNIGTTFSIYFKN
ncbi:PAS domain S-box protein [Pontibacter sp. SGAir0037]|uniref:PAS domain S-box protein n=1 Tax=Pontibacter sp. SGAir0037 TaxID=2571030 RepID=UPI0010CCFE1D|nr:PAS domain S-box protein [Pontibacter sp. SGAir0037]QCR22837.1 hypothetical protein C1N53_11110 [Pontibacter sp. SGAir0037]